MDVGTNKDMLLEASWIDWMALPANPMVEPRVATPTLTIEGLLRSYFHEDPPINLQV